MLPSVTAVVKSNGRRGRLHSLPGLQGVRAGFSLRFLVKGIVTMSNTSVELTVNDVAANYLKWSVGTLLAGSAVAGFVVPGAAVFNQPVMLVAMASMAVAVAAGATACHLWVLRRDDKLRGTSLSHPAIADLRQQFWYSLVPAARFATRCGWTAAATVVRTRARLAYFDYLKVTEPHLLYTHVGELRVAAPGTVTIDGQEQPLPNHSLVLRCYRLLDCCDAQHPTMGRVVILRPDITHVPVTWNIADVLHTLLCVAGPQA